MSDSAAVLNTRRQVDKVLVAFVAVGILVIFGYGLSSRSTLEGGPAPSFTLPLYNGGQISLEEMRGQVVVLNFWASWCAPCRAEAPTLEKAWREYKDRGVAFVGVSVKDVADKAQGFVKQFDVTYPNGYDPYSRIWKAYRLTAVPETFFITKEGIVAKHHLGHISEQDLRAALDELLPSAEKGND